jgi:hypothetical protein
MISSKRVFFFFSGSVSGLSLDLPVVTSFSFSIFESFFSFSFSLVFISGTVCLDERTEDLLFSTYSFSYSAFLGSLG